MFLDYPSTIMSKTIFSLFAALMLVSTFSITGAVSTFAQALPGQTYKVTANKGLNIRDKDCKVMTTMVYGSLVSSVPDGNGSFPTINCTINGKTMSLMAMTYAKPGLEVTSNMFVTGYAAPEYIQKVASKLSPDFEGGYLFNVQPTDGLNLRDENCKRIKTLPYKTEVRLTLYGKTNGIICEVNGQKYSMTKIQLLKGGNNFEEGYVATTYL
jgi:hypothetical protein